MAKKTQLKIKLVKSGIGYSKKQKDTLIALGLRKLNSETIKDKTPEIEGMLAKVSHLISVEEV